MDAANTVLVISDYGDETVHAVIEQLHRWNATVIHMDIGDFPHQVAIAATITGRQWRGKLVTSESTLELEEVGSVYYRRPTQFVFPDNMSAVDAIFAAAEARQGLGGTLAALDASG